MSKNIFRTALVGAAAVITVTGGMVATSAPASAQGYVTGPVYRGGFAGPRYVAAPRYYGGGGYYGHRRYGYRNNGGAVAAGLIGGLALGALATSSYNYNYGYGYAPAGYGYAPAGYGYGYAPARSYGYGYAPVTYGYGGCFIERRIRVNRYGERVIRDVEVCR
ncbi:hypothetical protein [Salinarimonas soli]|uniref:hypothetical protein n=1 Tax=Salinarimonas soli TaxID=1638099 RepID=UPI001F0B23EA|nr:hypothetical protein [Salinarimonas soli]